MGCSEAKPTAEANSPSKDTPRNALQRKDSSSKRILATGASFQEEALLYNPNSSEEKLKSHKWDAKLQNSDYDQTLLNWKNECGGDFYESVKSGPPPKYRWAAWKALLEVSKIWEEGLYSTLVTEEVKRTAKCLPLIQADSQYVFHDYLSHTRTSDKNELIGKVENVLVAITVYKPEVGYGPGMNYIVAFMLLVSGMKEEEVFWGFMGFCRGGLSHDSFKLCIANSLYAKDSPKSDFLLSAFNILCDADKLRLRLDQVKVTDKLWIYSWMLKMYLTFFPFNYCLRFWDFVLASGFTRVLVLSAAVLKSTIQLFQDKNFTQCYNILNSFKHGNNLPTPEEIIAIAEDIRLSANFKNFIAENNPDGRVVVEAPQLYEVVEETGIMVGLEDEHLPRPSIHSGVVVSATKSKVWH